MSVFVLARCFEFFILVHPACLLLFFLFLWGHAGARVLCVYEKKQVHLRFLKLINVHAGPCFHAANANDWRVYILIKFFGSSD